MNWSKFVPSESMVRDPIGLWNHLNIQEEFTPGITSVTDRIRYYTLLAYYWEHLDSKITPRDFERIFILACLGHHNGASEDPHLLHVFNKRRFDKEWDSKERFDLKFDINGFGKTYYNAQLEVFACSWIDPFGQKQLSPINSRLSSCIPIAKELLLQSIFTKEQLADNYESLCICDSEANEKEIDIISKLFFGFFSVQEGVWNIDEKGYGDFIAGKNIIELDFKQKANGPVIDALLDTSSRVQKSIKRRNTLLLFLKIIKETEPLRTEMRRTIWDAIYFSQRRNEFTHIEFGRLEEVRKVWEYFQLNIYYIFAIESILDVIQKLIRAQPDGLRRNVLLENVSTEKFYKVISSSLGLMPASIADLTYTIQGLSGNTRTILGSKLNESLVFDEIIQATKVDNVEVKLANILLMICLIQHRFKQTDIDIRYRYPAKEPTTEIVENKLQLDKIILSLDSGHKDDAVIDYLAKVIDDVIERHLSQSALRLSWGTRNWIFIEEEGMLYPTRRDLVQIAPRDNRWDSIFNLLNDTKFVVKDEKDRVILTEKGKLWLSRIE